MAGGQKDNMAVIHDEPTEKQLEAATRLVKRLLRFFDIKTLGGAPRICQEPWHEPGLSRNPWDAHRGADASRVQTLGTMKAAVIKGLGAVALVGALWAFAG